MRHYECRIPHHHPNWRQGRQGGERRENDRTEEESTGKSAWHEGGQNRAPTKSQADVARDYHAHFKEAVDQLFKKNNDPDEARLSRDQCAAVLTLGFNKFTRVGSNKCDHLRKRVKEEIVKGYGTPTNRSRTFGWRSRRGRQRWPGRRLGRSKSEQH